MLKKIFRIVYFVTISIVLSSILFASWTSYVFFTEASKSGEINKVIKDMYNSEKSFALDVIDLTKILIEDTSQNRYSEDNTLQGKEELVTEQGLTNQTQEPLPKVENSENPLGIVIEPFEESSKLDNEDIEMPVNGINMDEYSKLEP